METNKLKQINQQIQEIEQQYQDGEMDITESTCMIEDILKEYRGEDRVIALKDYKLPPHNPANHFVSGIGKLDEIIGSFKKGDIFTITAASGVGKSTLAREFLIRFSEQKKKCLYFSYEDRNEGLIEKLGDNIPDGYIPMSLNDKSLVWIEARILEAILKFGVEIVFIDNLKSITDFMARNVNNSLEFTMQKIKEIAMKYNILVFLCAHIKKEENKIIDLNSIKDSSAVADISSLVFALQRQPDKFQSKEDKQENGIKMSNISIINIIKNRNNGILKGFSLMFRPNGLSGRFTEDLGFVDLKDIKSEKLF
jgi:replicative DNA helicase